MKLRYYSAILFFTLLTATHSQTYEWAKNIVGKNFKITDINTDVTNNIYITGSFSDTIQIGIKTLISYGFNDFFVIKFDSAGNALWAISGGGTGNDISNSIASDFLGNCYITGDIFSINAIFDTTNLKTNKALFVAKVSNEGKVKWFKSIDYSSSYNVDHSSASSKDIELDNSGNLYVTGWNNNYKGFAEKLSTDGVSVWYRQVPGPLELYRYGLSIHISNQNILYISGAEGGFSNCSGGCNNRFFINILYASDGYTKSSTVINMEPVSNQEQYSNRYFSKILTNKNGQIYYLFNFNKTLNPIKINGNNVSLNNHHDGTFDIFLLKLKPDLSISWGKVFGSNGNDYVNAMVCDGDGSLTLTGSFQNKAYFDRFSVETKGTDIFTTKIDSSGNVLWLKKTGNDQINGGQTIALASDPKYYYTSGSFMGTMLFDQDTLTSDLIDRGSYLAKLGCKPSQPGPINGDTVVCLGTSKYFITSNSASTTFRWSLSGGGTIVSSNDTITVNWDTTGLHQLTVTPIGECGDGLPRSIFVKVKAIPRLEKILGDTLACIGTEAYNTDIYSETDYTWSATGGNTIFGINNTAIVNWVNTGLHKVSVYAKNSCGTSNVRTTDVEVNKIPDQPAEISGNNDVCTSSENYSIVQANKTVYTWNLSSGGTLNYANNNATVNWIAAGTHTISVTPGNYCGTGSSRSLPVTVSVSPAQPSAIIGNNDVCTGQHTFSIAEVNGVSYNWALSGGGTVNSSKGSASAYFVSPGNYTLKVTPQNKCGQGASRSLAIAVRSLPDQPSTIVGLDSVCLSKQEYLTPAINDNNYNWSLSGGGDILPNNNLVSIDWKTAGTYTLTVSPFNMCGQGKSLSQKIYVKNIAYAKSEIIGQDTSCLVKQVYYIASQPGLSYNWKLDKGGVLVSDSNRCSINWQQQGWHLITVSSNNGCSSALNVGVFDIPTMPTGFTGDTDICIGDFNYMVAGTSNTNYEWNITGGGNLSPLKNTAIITWNTQGNYSIKVKQGNFCGWSSTLSKNIIINKIPEIPSEIVGAKKACITSEIYTVNASTGVTYNWSVSGNGVITNTNNVATISWVKASSNIIYVTSSNKCGTSPIQSFDVVVSNKPAQPSINGPVNTCSGDAIYTVKTKIKDEIYNWDIKNGSVNWTTSNDSLFTNWVTPGSYIIQLAPSNYCGLGKDTSIIITVKGVPEKPTGIDGSTTTCPGIQGYLVKGTTQTDYNWSITGGGSIRALGNSATINWTTAGNYTITVSPINNCGFGTSLSLPVNIYLSPSQPGPISGDSSTCIGNADYSVVKLNGINYTWLLDNGGQLSSTENKATANWQQTGTHILSCVASNACGSSPSRNKPINITTLPLQPFILEQDTITCLGTRIYSVNSYPNTSYEWSLSSGGSVLPQNNIASVNWKEKGKHTLTVIPKNACGNGISRSKTIYADKTPELNALIIGDTSICIGTNKYDVNLIDNTDYQWLVSSGGSISSDNNTAVINWQNGGQHTISVVPSNQCGNGNAVSLNVNVNEKPGFIGNIIGENEVCAGIEKKYEIPFFTGVNYKWDLNHGGLLKINRNAASILWNAEGNHTISVIPANKCGNGQKSYLNVFVNGIKPVIENAILGDTIICKGQKEYYTVDFINNAEFNWSVTPAADLVNLTNGTLINWVSPGEYTISTSALNQCGASNQVTQKVLVEDDPVIPSITIVFDSLKSSSVSNNQWLYFKEPIEGATHQYYKPVQKGQYSVRVTNSCRSINSVETYYSDNSINNLGVYMLPNPARDFIKISCPINVKWYEIRVITLTGNTVALYKYNGEPTLTIPTYNYRSGFYIFNIATVQGIAEQLILVYPFY